MLPEVLVLVYFGIGCLIASVSLWRNELGYRDDASVVAMFLDAILVAVSWGMILVWFAFMVPFIWLSERWPLKNIDEWNRSQYD